MNTNKSNGLLMLLALILFGAVCFIVIVVAKGEKQENSATEQQYVIYDVSQDEFKELGLTAGDTPHDTLKTLVGALKDVRSEVQKVSHENERLKRENQTLRMDSANVSQQIHEAVHNKQQELTSIFEQRIAEVHQQIKKNTEQHIPIGQGQSSNSLNYSVETPPETLWISPSDQLYTDKQGNDNYRGEKLTQFPNPFKALDDSVLGQSVQQFTGKEGRFKDNSITQNKTPFYTLSENATLMGTVAMTALIGRVPINGTVSDPYPFKAIIGRENLTANGIELPDITGAIVSGTTTGDWTLSCVRGDVTSITFVFSDGRIATSRQNANDKSIGWISNPDGIPCVPGERKTNAPEYLTSQFLLSGAEAAAQSLAMGQTTTVVDSNSVVGAVTGDQGRFILGQALGGGLRETSDWFRQRYGQTFDAVYVPPGHKIAIHINQQIPIDYDSSSRKVKYEQANMVSQLD